MTTDTDPGGLSGEIEELEKQLRITRNKDRARDYEQRNEWAEALRLYTEVLKDDPEDEDALAGVKCTRESLLMQLYARGMEHLDAGGWAAAVKTFDQLLQEAEQAGLSDYQDARARRQEAQEKITPSPPPRRVPTWAIAAAGAAGVVLVLVILFTLVLQPGVFSPLGTTEPSATVVVLSTESPEPTTETSEPSPSPATPTHVILTETPPAGLSPTFEPSETPTQTGDTPTSQPVTDTTTLAAATETPTTRPATDTPTLQPTPTGKIAVSVFDPNTEAYSIYVARASDGWQPKLFFQNGSQPAFSPDGRQIILRSWRKAEEGIGQRLVLFPSLRLDAGDERLMTYNLEDAHPSISRGGDIVFHTRREGAPILVTLGTWPGAENDIANQRKLGPGENPDWLGNRIVYYAPGPPPGLYVMNADGSHAQLALSEPGSLAPAAAPDGDHVAVSLQRGGRWHVFTLSVSQGQTSLTQLTNENADDQLPVWSPDGQFIAFVSNREGKWAVWVMPAPGAQVNADGSAQRKLFDLNGPIDGRVSIAPNMSYGWGEERLSWAP